MAGREKSERLPCRSCGGGRFTRVLLVFPPLSIDTFQRDRGPLLQPDYYSEWRRQSVQLHCVKWQPASRIGAHFRWSPFRHADCVRHLYIRDSAERQERLHWHAIVFACRCALVARVRCRSRTSQSTECPGRSCRFGRVFLTSRSTGDECALERFCHGEGTNLACQSGAFLVPIRPF